MKVVNEVMRLSSKRNIKEIYRHESEIYDKTREIFESGRFAFKERKLMSEFIRKNSSILFLACGTGRHLKFVTDVLRSDVVGVDISVNMLQIAKTKRKVQFVAADVENLPFRPGSFDGAACSRAFYLFKNKPKTLVEARNVLKEGGELLVTSVFKDLALTRLGITLGLFGDDPKEYPYTSKQLCEMFIDAGLRNVERRCVVSFTGDPKYVPSWILRAIDCIEDKMQGGRWVMAIGKK